MLDPRAAADPVQHQAERLRRGGLRHVAVVIAALSTGVACAAPAWRNVDAARDTVAAFEHDQYECREGSRSRTMHRRWGEDRLSPYTVVDEDAVLDCLSARGWRRLP